MTIVRQEFRQGRNALIIWASIISFMLGICILIYPEMESQMTEISGTFSNMGSFSAAFGMDKINFGEFMGYFGIECGNILGLGGAFFASLLGFSALAKEERDHTAEFLFSHPVSRRAIILQKLCAVFLQIVALNAVTIGVTILAAGAIGGKPDAGKLALSFLAYFIMQIEMASICFGFSALAGKTGAGAGLGIAALCYFLNIIANLTEEAKFLKYLTPFGYTDSADIIANGEINAGYLAAGTAFAVIGIAAAFFLYEKKDIT